MNSSYVYIELDTTKPQIEIYAPQYTTQDIVNQITIEANEKISDHHEVWIIDSNGVRHDYVFSKIRDSQLTGLIRLNNLPIGISTIYAKVSDDVGNVSDIASHSFMIKESLSKLFVKVKDSVARIKLSDKSTGIKIKVSDKSMRMKINDSSSN